MITLPTTNFPQALRQVILHALEDPLATPDTALIIADALDAYATSLPAGSHFIEPVRTAAIAVRDHAPSLDNMRAAP